MSNLAAMDAMSFTTKAFDWMRRKPVYTLMVYMKSGNVIPVAGVEEYNIKYTGNEVTMLAITQRHRRRVPRLLVGATDLSQIEAVTVRRE